MVVGISGIDSLIWLNLKMTMDISSSKEITHNLWCELFIEVCKIPASSDTSNEPLIRSKKLGDSVYYILKHVWNTKEWNNVDSLLQCWTKKVMKEKDEFRDSNSQFKPCINDLRACRYALRKSLFSSSWRNEIADSQT